MAPVVHPASTALKSTSTDRSLPLAPLPPLGPDISAARTIVHQIDDEISMLRESVARLQERREVYNRAIQLSDKSRFDAIAVEILGLIFELSLLVDSSS